jgi:hypothetical protein
MSQIIKLSALADSFPETEVEYEDLLGLPYRAGGRIVEGAAGTDCIGVVLEIYRRAGLGLPDPGRADTGIFGFASVLEQVADCDHLYDLVNLRRQSNHLAVIVRYGTVLTAAMGQGVYAVRVNHYRRLAGVEFWRVQDACLP